MKTQLINFKAPARSDLRAGVTTAIILIPQAMAYALIADLPPSMGLYASILPLLVYASLGSSSSTAIGPVSMDCLLMGMALSSLAMNTQDRLAIAIALTCSVGIAQIILSFLGAARLSALITGPILTGFAAAAAYLIGATQFEHFVGLYLKESPSLILLPFELLHQVQGWNLSTFAFGMFSLIGLVLSQRIAPKLPNLLIMVVVSISLSWFFGFAQGGILCIGDIPSGLPQLSLPDFSALASLTLSAQALPIAILGFLEVYAAGEALKSEGSCELSGRRELAALGASNVASSLTGGLVVSASFSRTAINGGSGAKTRWAGVVSAMCVVVTLLCLTHPLSMLPKVSLAVMIFSALPGLVKVNAMKTLYREARGQFGVMLITLVATILFGLIIGMVSGIVANQVIRLLNHYSMRGA